MIQIRMLAHEDRNEIYLFIHRNYCHQFCPISHTPMMWLIQPKKLNCNLFSLETFSFALCCWWQFETASLHEFFRMGFSTREISLECFEWKRLRQIYYMNVWVSKKCQKLFRNGTISVEFSEIMDWNFGCFHWDKLCQKFALCSFWRPVTAFGTV